MLGPTILRDFVSLLLGKYWANDGIIAENRSDQMVLLTVSGRRPNLDSRLDGERFAWRRFRSAGALSRKLCPRAALEASVKDWQYALSSIFAW